MVRNASWKTDTVILEDAVVAEDGGVEGKRKKGRGVGKIGAGQQPDLCTPFILADPAGPILVCASLPRQCFNGFHVEQTVTLHDCI